MTTAETRESAPEWHAWIAENLLRGAAPFAIADTMVQNGVDPEVAQRAVAAAAEHPYVAGARVASQAAAEKAAADVQAARKAPAPGGERAKKYAWFLEVTRRAARQSAHYGEVPRVHNPSAEEFLEQFYSRNRPCIIEGAMADWPALERWQSADYLKQAVGDQLVEVQSRGGDANADLSTPSLAKELPFSEFVDIVESGIEANDWYMIANNGERNLDAILPLLDDLRYPPFLKRDPTQTFLWYGPKGIETPIHHDLTNNLMAQVRGRKQVRLIAPFESAHVYNYAHRYSRVDAFAIDYEQFPAMQDVRVIDVEIGAGDMLFVPVGWWHAVRGLDVSMTLTLMAFAYDNDFYSFYETYGEL